LAANPSRLSAGGAVLAVPTSDALCRAGMSPEDLHSASVDRTGAFATVSACTHHARSRVRRRPIKVPYVARPERLRPDFELRPSRDRSDYASHAFSREWEAIACTLSPAGPGHPVEVTRLHLLLLSALGGWNPFSFEVGRPSSRQRDKMPLSDLCNRLPIRASARRSILETQPGSGFPLIHGRETGALPFLERDRRRRTNSAEAERSEPRVAHT
jgi:hypothetical protein